MAEKELIEIEVDEKVLKSRWGTGSPRSSLLSLLSSIFLPTLLSPHLTREPVPGLDLDKESHFCYY